MGNKLETWKKRYSSDSISSDKTKSSGSDSSLKNDTTALDKWKNKYSAGSVSENKVSSSRNTDTNRSYAGTGITNTTSAKSKGETNRDTKYSAEALSDRYYQLSDEIKALQNEINKDPIYNPKKSVKLQKLQDEYASIQKPTTAKDIAESFGIGAVSSAAQIAYSAGNAYDTVKSKFSDDTELKNINEQIKTLQSEINSSYEAVPTEKMEALSDLQDQYDARLEEVMKSNKSVLTSQSENTLDNAAKFMDSKKDRTSKIGETVLEIADTTGSMANTAIVGGTIGAGLSSVAPGAAFLANASHNGRMIALAASASGASAYSARKEGATPGQAFAYGVISGAVEVLSENLFDGNPLYDNDSGFVKRIVSKLTQNENFWRILDSIPADKLNEGLEEVVSSVLEPLAKRMSGIDKTATIDWDETIDQGIMGVLTSIALLPADAAKGIISSYDSSKSSISKADARDYVRTISTDENGNRQSIPIEEQKGYVDEVLSRGYDEGSEVYKRAVKAKEKLDKGQYIQDTEYGRLAISEMDEINNKKAQDATANVRREIASRVNKPVDNYVISALEDIKNTLGKTGRSVIDRFVDITADNNIDQYRDFILVYNAGVNASRVPETSSLSAEQEEAAYIAGKADRSSMYNSDRSSENPNNTGIHGNTNNTGIQVISGEVKNNTSDSTKTKLEDASRKYGNNASDFVSAYDAGQDVQEYDKAYKATYEYGRSGVPFDTVKSIDSVSYLTDTQLRLAYEAGKSSAYTEANNNQQKRILLSNGNTGRRIGVVKGEGVNIADLKASFNDQQGRAYRVLSAIAEATGIDIVLYKSKAGADGKYRDAQGAFKRSNPNTIYIDIDAGISNIKDVSDLAKYSMLRTFSHEFTHFVEYWNPVQYNEMRKVIFNELSKCGENVNDLIESKIEETGLPYERASREVVAEALTDILPDSNFAKNMAENHKSLFNKLLEKLKEFAADLRAYFDTIGKNRSREANALKEQIGDTIKYIDSVIDIFDKAAEGAVDTFQKAYAVEEVVAENETTTDGTEAEKVTKKAPATEEAKPGEAMEAEPEIKTTTSKYGYTITDNPQYNSVEINTVGETEATPASVETQNPAPSESETVKQESHHKTRFPSAQMKNGTPSEKTAYSILTDYLRTGKQLTSKDLYAICDEAFGGTQAEGKYDRKDAYDAMELAVNKYLVDTMQKYNTGTVENALEGLKKMQSILDLLPTQNVRTEEQQQYQQFSTPPNIAYLAAWAANINNTDSVLEPSAGIGGLASFAKAWGAEVTVNELSKRRLEVLKAMGFDNVFNENAEQIDNILPDNIQPSVVIMNPPFSSTAGRTATNKTSNAERHIDQALERLSEGGRLVAILGRGMNNDSYSKYWNRLRQNYTIRANISIDGENYKKYGTTFDVQLVVIDKVWPHGDVKTLTGSFKDISQIPGVLEGVRNDRSSEIKRNTAVQSNQVNNVPVSDRGNKPVSVSVDQNDTGADRGVERGNRADDGRNGKSGSTDIQRHRERNSGNLQTTDGNDRTGIRYSGTNLANQENTEGENGGGVVGRVSDSAGNDDGKRTRKRDRPASEPARSGEVTEEVRSEERNDDGVFADYVAPQITVTGSKHHPAVLVESSAMSAVSMPKATYVPHLPEDVIKNSLSTEQLVSVVYAGQAHEQILPSGERKGFFIGDGTGVGKGREISGIILDNFQQGRKKALWVSMNDHLLADAQRDWTDTTGRSKDEVHLQGKTKLQDKIDFGDGILFTTYPTLRTEKGQFSRINQIVEWFGKDFDGVIAFDEAHNMGNLIGKRGVRGKSTGSAMAIAAVELQKKLPNARVVYVSATAATEVDGLAFASRLGLWGRGTAFQDVNDFVSSIGSSGLAAMELVIRDMKAMGVYVSRSISYNGVNYDTIQHNLDPMQTIIYDTMSEAWQKTMTNVEASLESTGGKYNSNARAMAIGQYYNAMQRFYNQVLTSMSMPSVIADMRKELAAGRSCVLQIVNTNQAEADRQIADIKANGGELDDMDLTPRGTLIGYLEKCYPVNQYEEYTDDQGNLRSRLVVDSQGNPVVDKAAVRMRDALIEEIKQMSIPDGPLEMLFNAFGTEQVSEITGRTRRVVPRKMPDGSIQRVEESRTKTHTAADVDAFQSGKKRILIFSDAGGTGKSYHASRTAKNQQQRVHYVLQPGWIASKAVQGFGRTHRSNQASAPVYKLVTTNIKGQKRFTSTIARRLDQLGALTKGQRNTGSGMFGAKDNLETDLARDSLREFYRRLGKNQIEGLDGKQTIKRLGLTNKFTDQYGAFKLDDATSRDISTFLNRIIALKVDEQNTVFDAFINIYETFLEEAMNAGTLDTGMENVKADKIEIVDDKVIKEQESTGATTHYIQAKVYTKPKLITTVDAAKSMRAGFDGIYKTKNGDIRAVYRIADKTTEFGAIEKQYMLLGPNYVKRSTWKESTFEKNAELLPKGNWQSEWDKELKKVPEYNEEVKHMLTGTLLPIWNALPTEGNTKVQRLISDDGKSYLGRVINKDQIDDLLKRFNLNRTKETFTAQSVMDSAIKKGVRFKLNYQRAEIFRSMVSGEWRLEYRQLQNTWGIKRMYPDMMSERINYQDRYFIPMNEKGAAILEKILSDNPVASTSEDADDGTQYQNRTSPLTDREVLSIAASEVNVSDLSDGEKDALRIFQQKLTTLHELEQKRAEEGQLYKEQQFGQNVDRDAAQKTLNRMKVMDDQIKRASADVLKVEKAEVLQKVLQKARTVVETKEREHGRELLNRYRDRQKNAALIKKYKSRIKTDTDSLKKWIIQPNNKNALQHVPDALKNSIIPFLTSIDFTSKQHLRGGAATQADEEFLKQLTKLKSAIKQNIDVQGMYSGYNDLPEGFMDELQKFIDSAQTLADSQEGQFVINRMTSEELKTLSKLVRVVKKLIVNMNAFHQNAMFKHTYEAGDSSIDFMSKIKNPASTGKISNFILWQQIRPAYAFERFGDGGKAIFDEFRRGQATLAFNAEKIKDFREKTYNDDVVMEWEEKSETFEFGEDAVTIPVSYLMGFYELSKQKDSLEHILGGGLRVATYSVKKGIKKEKYSDVGHELTMEQVNEMNNRLKTKYPKAVEVADKLQKFMQEEGGKWFNYVSVARFGEEQANEPNYYPINTDGRILQSNADEYPSAASLYALLNAGFTKSRTEGANNRIVLYSIFDVFSNHMASMAQYNAFALPILDSLKWFNYKQKDEYGNITGSVRDEMDRAYGAPEETRPGKGSSGYAETFVMNIIKAFNGTEAQGVPEDTQWINELHRYNMAQVAYNFRVVVQQPLAITRAGMLVDYKNIIKGLTLSPKKIKANIAEMQKYSGIAAWKALGFYDVNISRGLTEIIKGNKTALEKIGDFGMAGAELADTVTWSAIWSACKEQVLREYGKSSDEEYFAEVTNLFEDVIYKTQVVDSVLTKNEYLRSKGLGARALGSFMSEPTTTASMLIDAYDKYSLDRQRGLSRQQTWKLNGKNIVRTAYVYAIGSLLLSAVTSVIDAWRDDDDYQTFFQKWLEAFGGNLLDEANPLNKLPRFRDFYDLVKTVLGILGFDTYGNEPRSVIFQWSDYLVTASKIFHDKINGEKTSYTWYGGAFKLLQALSGMTGFPMAGATRELVSAWNNVIGSMAPSLKVKTYDPEERTSIKYAYLDGYISEDEATDLLIENGIAKNENDAYWIINEFDGRMKYSRIKEAIDNDDMDAFIEAKKELTEHGVEERYIKFSVKEYIKENYDSSSEELLSKFIDSVFGK